MREFPQYGERYQHHEGRTVRILNLQRAREAISQLNPEFAYEVIFEYELSGNVTVMPLPWFAEVYSKIADAPRNLAPRLAAGQLPLRLHPSVKVVYSRQRETRRPTPEHDDTHYSRFL
ncbi:hypothetical protein ACIP8G_23475 [Serratia liquefaciens]|uniref:hypothetical protein n=1 Tax=Serratia liquefaciens TaxID=614 RepID=UPI00382BDBED